MAKSPNDKAPMNYKSAGLDLELYEQTIDAMAPLVKRTHTPRVMGGFGGFCGMGGCGGMGGFCGMVGMGGFCGFCVSFWYDENTD